MVRGLEFWEVRVNDGMVEMVRTSLETVKLVVSVLTPIAVVMVGILVARATARIEQTQWPSQKVVEYQLKVSTWSLQKLDRLLGFYTFVGRWKELTATDVLRLKRELDPDSMSTGCSSPRVTSRHIRLDGNVIQRTPLLTLMR